MQLSLAHTHLLSQPRQPRMRVRIAAAAAAAPSAVKPALASAAPAVAPHGGRALQRLQQQQHPRGERPQHTRQKHEQWQQPYLTSSTGTALGVVAAAAAAALLLPLAADASAGPLGVASTFVPGLVGDNPFTEGAVSSFLLILFSEIGDKTFFIAVLLALQQSRSSVFVGTFGALAIMTVISVLLGQVFHQLDELLPAVPGGVPLDDALAIALLVFFGLQTLAGAFKAPEGESEEEEAKEVVAAMSPGGEATLVLSTFALVFAAEWGDKSFLATIALAAASSPAGVIAGAITGHGVATVIAVLGGSVLGKYASERAVQLAGGSLFLVFAAATAYDVVRGV